MNYEVWRMSVVNSESVIASITLMINGCWKIDGFKLIRNKEGEFWVSMPARKNLNNKWIKTVHCDNIDEMNAVQDLIIKEYNRRLGEV